MNEDIEIMPEFYNKHYASIDGRARILEIWSDGPNPGRDTETAICINEKGSYQVYLEINGTRTIDNPSVTTMDGIPLYKWDGETVKERTEEEIAADRAAIPAPPPSPQEQLRADVDFIAALQGVSL